ncbi:MAG TPA: hypothetical protein VFB78_06555 [Acidimicrobiales bacterium]|nr:hypothetical protein [Acidimicrobiales bacterium]
MRLIRPEFDEPELLAWWEPLITLARHARLAQPPYAVHLEDFTFRGRVKRSGRPWHNDDGDDYAYNRDEFAGTPPRRPARPFRPRSHVHLRLL